MNCCFLPAQRWSAVPDLASHSTAPRAREADGWQTLQRGRLATTFTSEEVMRTSTHYQPRMAVCFSPACLLCAFPRCRLWQTESKQSPDWSDQSALVQALLYVFPCVFLCCHNVFVLQSFERLGVFTFMERCSQFFSVYISSERLEWWVLNVCGLALSESSGTLWNFKKNKNKKCNFFYFLKSKNDYF